jgi:hypothetical protein
MSLFSIEGLIVGLIAAQAFQAWVEFRLFKRQVRQDRIIAFFCHMHGINTEAKLQAILAGKQSLQAEP